MNKEDQKIMAYNILHKNDNAYKPKTRTKLSLRLGILAGIIWGLFLAAYYTMLPDPRFAIICASFCFVALVIFIFTWPHLIRAFKTASKEGKKERGEI